MSKSKIPIVLAFDQNYVPIAAVFICSVLKNVALGRACEFYAIVDKVDVVDQIRINDLVSTFTGSSIVFIEGDAAAYGTEIDSGRHITASTFFRLTLATALSHLDKVIYLDVDMVCTGDVSELIELDIGDYVYAAALDLNHLAGVHKGDWQKPYYTDELSWPDEHLLRYKQAGVLVMNLKKIRDDGYEREFSKYLGAGFRMMDQDIINIAVPVDQVFELPPEWNLLTALGSFRESKEELPRALFDAYMNAYASPKIIHFGGPMKPWNSIGASRSLHHIFWEYARQTDYYSHLLLKTVSNSLGKKQQCRYQRGKAGSVLAESLAAFKDMLASLGHKSG